MTNSIKSFKDLMSLIPTSVSIVTCIDERQVFGCTISSLVSLDVGIDSAKILFVLKKESLIGTEISKNKYFSINVLTNTQQKYAEYYSREREPDEINYSKWQIENAKYALLLNSIVIFKCELYELIDTYPANIFVGKVIDANLGSEVKPLIYSSRKYHEIKE